MSSSHDIVDTLVTRETRAAERRIGLLRAGLMIVMLCVVVPLRVVLYGPTGGSGNVGWDAGVTLFGLVASVALGRWMSRPTFPSYVRYLAICLDYGILAALIASQAGSGYNAAAQQSVDTYALILPVGIAFTALSGLRLSSAQTFLSGAFCMGLIAETLWIDTVVHGAPFYLITALLLSTLTIAVTFGANLTVTKTRRLIAEASGFDSEAKRVKRVLSRYVSEPVAETILQDMTDGAGERQRVTIMFVDIRGFTTISEKLAPEDVVSLLNRYFSRMVRAVFEYDGMLDKYMGDGMMAVFGAPVSRPDHAYLAVQAALRIREELVAFNQELAASGRSPMAIGVGIHTGDCVIGNIGTEQRLDYTAIGDPVNTASRIESLTKEHGVDILISGETFAEVWDRVEADPVSNVPIRGKSRPLDLFIVRGLRTTVPAAEVLN